MYVVVRTCGLYDGVATQDDGFKGQCGSTPYVACIVNFLPTSSTTGGGGEEEVASRGQA